MKNLNTCVVGLGYIGLPTSLTLAKFGINVVGVDVNKEVVETLNSGNVHIEEPGIDELLTEVAENGKFKASLDVVKANYFIIALLSYNIYHILP